MFRTYQVMPKDYWQPEDLGHIEETDGFPLPPTDEEGKALNYIWIPSDSLRALSGACKRMVDALSGAEVKQRISDPDGKPMPYRSFVAPYHSRRRCGRYRPVPDATPVLSLNSPVYLS